MPLALALALALLAACQRGAAPRPPPRRPRRRARACRPAAPAFAHVEDFDEGIAKAKAEGKAVLVDAWAPWCHTCLSMQNYVLNDPSLAPLAERVVLVELDTDKPENAAFLEKYTVSVWPTFFVIDPASGEATGLWPGSASVNEFRGFVEDGLAAHRGEGCRSGFARARLCGGEGQAGRPATTAGAAEGLRARRREGAGRLAAAQRSTDGLAVLAVAGRSSSRVRAGRPRAPGRGEGRRGAGRLRRDPARLRRRSAGRPTPRPRTRKRSRACSEFTADPPADASADDRADAWNILSYALADAGDEAGARSRRRNSAWRCSRRPLAGIEDPLLAQTFDYARAQAYVALDRGDEAVKMLEAREKELPNSYEPPARLASALSKMEKLPEALVAVDRAIAKSYGPRQLLYVKQKADIQGRMGDHAGQVATLKQEVAGYEALAKGHARPEGARGREEAPRRGRKSAAPEPRRLETRTSGLPSTRCLALARRPDAALTGCRSVAITVAAPLALQRAPPAPTGRQRSPSPTPSSTCATTSACR